MSRYAQNTTVTTENSRMEIERTLQRYGATSFAYGWDADRALIEFAAHERRVRFVLPLPRRDDPEFTVYRRSPTSTPTKRTPAEAEKRHEQACRQRWRALALVVKAKLEAVEAGITTFEDEFMAHVVLPNGSTFGQWARPQLARVYQENTMPPLLALGADADA